MTRVRSKKRLLGSMVGILLFGAAFIIWLSVPQPTANFPISFVGVTNNATGNILATFSITNQTPWTISYSVCPAQVQSNGIWSPLPSAKGVGCDLRPHQVGTFTLPVPSPGRAWRVPVFWGCEPTGSAYLRGVVKSNLRLNWYLIRHGRSPKLNRGAEFDLFVSYSPELTR